VGRFDVGFIAMCMACIPHHLPSPAAADGGSGDRSRARRRRDADGRYRWPADSVVDRAPCRAGSALVFFQVPRPGGECGDGKAGWGGGGGLLADAPPRWGVRGLH